MDREKVVTALTADTYEVRGVNLLCPVCGFEYTHIRKVYTRLGVGDGRPGDGEGKVFPGTLVVGTTTQRRSTLVVVFDCENGHRFELNVTNQKGVNFLDFVEVDAQAGELNSPHFTVNVGCGA